MCSPKCKHSTYDLVLVNRKLDIDYSDGTEVIRTLKGDSKTADVPLMLVTNYPEHQEAAIAAGRSAASANWSSANPKREPHWPTF